MLHSKLSILDKPVFARQCRFMNDRDPARKDWRDAETGLILSDYFDILRLELSGQPFVKLHRNKALQELTGRSKGSIEFKRQNISAILRELGMPWIIGYKPIRSSAETRLNSPQGLCASLIVTSWRQK